MTAPDARPSRWPRSRRRPVRTPAVGGLVLARARVGRSRRLPRRHRRVGATTIWPASPRPPVAALVDATLLAYAPAALVPPKHAVYVPAVEAALLTTVQATVDTGDFDAFDPGSEPRRG